LYENNSELEDSSSLSEGVKSMPNLTEEEIIQSLKKTLESEEFKSNKEEILQMIKNDDMDKAFAFVLTTQRAMMRALTGILFNPFYEISRDQ